MAEQTLKAKETSVYELREAIRQAHRYLGGTNPSARLVIQRMDKVNEKLENAKHYRKMLRLI